MTGSIRADIYFPHSFCDAVMALLVTWAGSCHGWPHLHTRLRGRKTAWNHAARTMASSLYHVGGCKKRLGEDQKSADFCNISWYPWQPSAEVWTPLKENLISSSRDQLSRLNKIANVSLRKLSGSQTYVIKLYHWKGFMVSAFKIWGVISKFTGVLQTAVFSVEA